MDFEATIREGLDNGVSIDDIAELFSETLNTIQQEEQKKNSTINKRRTVLGEMESNFYESIASDQLDCSDAAALFTLVMASKYTDWTAENIEDFFETIKNTAQTAAELIGKSPKEMFEMTLSKSKKILEDGLKSVTTKSDIAEFLKMFEL